MKLQSILKLGTAGAALLAFAATFIGRFLPGRLNESEFGLQLFVVREFRLELLTLGVAGLLIFVFWDAFARLGASLLRRLGGKLAHPRGLYGGYARWAAVIGVAVTSAVATGGAIYVGSKLLYVGKVNYVYLRDRVAEKYHRYLWREARLAQAAFDYVRASRVLDLIVKDYPEDAAAKAEAAFLKNLIAASDRLADLGKENLERYGVSPAGVALTAEALALNPGNYELRKRMESLMESASAGREAMYGILDRCEPRDGDRTKVPQRAFQYVVEYGDRRALAGAAEQARLRRRLCSEPVASEDPWSVVPEDGWHEREITVLLDETSRPRLAQRARDFAVAWALNDRGASDRPFVLVDRAGRSIAEAARIRTAAR